MQSDVPQVAELTWILTSLVNRGASRQSNILYKDKVAKGLNPNVGLYSYPILMAADILLFNSEIVPVGSDQKQHLEITREIANRFNNHYGEVFLLPKEEINENTKLVPRIDGQKMSKSYNNTIPIFDDILLVKKKIMKIKTDNAGVDEKEKHKKLPTFSTFCSISR